MILSRYAIYFKANIYMAKLLLFTLNLLYNLFVTATFQFQVFINGG